MSSRFDFLHQVSDDEIDPMGHVNNVAYVGWMQEAAIAHSTCQGWPPEKYRQHGWAWVVRTHLIEYRLPAFAGDQIIIRTWVADMQRASSRRRFEILREDRLLARAETKWAFVDVNSQRLIRIPAEVADSFEIVETAPLTGL